MRDRLIEILADVGLSHYETIADHLLANGVIVPPCKVGDTVYCLYKPCDAEETIVEVEVDCFEIRKGYVVIRGFCGENFYDYFVSEIGKTVFLTREDAEIEQKKIISHGCLSDEPKANAENIDAQLNAEQALRGDKE